MSVMANAASPCGVVDPAKPNIAPIILRKGAENLHKIYCFESTKSPYIIRVDLKRLNFTKDTSVKALKMAGNYHLAGDVTDQFEETPLFVFFGPDTKCIL